MHAAGMPEPRDDLTVYTNVISAGYFDTLRIALLRGRDFAASDRPEAVQVAIVNQAAAKLFFGTQDPIGRRIGPGRQGPAEIEVVGVVENAKYLSVREAPLPTVYTPFRGDSPMTLHVWSHADPRAVLQLIDREVRALDPVLPLYQVQTIEARVDDALRQERLVATLSTLLGSLATVIATVGLYGLIRFHVVQRTREIGIRIALGAGPRQILSMILRRAVVLVAIGIGLGLPLALAVLRVVSGFLYGVSPWQPAILAGVLGLLATVALAAGLASARIAARTDPCDALRHD
jgi:predicted permease